MAIRQLSVFVENKKGKLTEIMQVLSQGGVDIRALSIADTADYGILRMIVKDTDRALKTLKSARCVVSVTDVTCLEVADQPGSFAKAVQVLSDGDINLEYVYAFITPRKGFAYVVMRVDDNEAAADVLSRGGFRVVDDEELNRMFGA